MQQTHPFIFQTDPAKMLRRFECRRTILQKA